MKAYRILLTALVTALIALSWLPQTNELASAQVDAGLKRALVTFGSARVLNGVISTLQGTEVVAQPLGFGVTLSVGQVLDPVNDLVEQFSDLMLTATLVFGVEKFLLTLFGNWAVSALVTAVLGAWLVLYWRQTCPTWLSKLVLMVVFLRFAMPLVTIGSGAIFDIYSANDYAQNQAVLVGTSADLTPSLKAPIETLKSELAELRDMVDQAVESVVSLLVIFILQTLVLPLLLLWAYYRTLASIGHWRWLDRSSSKEKQGENL